MREDGTVRAWTMVETGCGRRLGVGRLLLTGPRAIGRVILRVDCRRDEHNQLWASLTADEARMLADRLLEQADNLDRAGA
jgi:hypothetical protein